MHYLPPITVSLIFFPCSFVLCIRQFSGTPTHRVDRVLSLRANLGNAYLSQECNIVQRKDLKIKVTWQ
jgi:hypothetical protein